MPNPERLDQEITRLEGVVQSGQPEGIAPLADLVAHVSPTADLFYVAWRVNRLVKSVRGALYPAPEPGRPPYSQAEQHSIKAGEDFFYKCLGKLNDKVRREQKMLASGAISASAAFAAATVKVLEQSGRSFRLILKTNQGKVATKLAPGDVEFD